MGTINAALPRNDTLRFLLGFFGMLSLGFVTLVAIGFYQVEFAGKAGLPGSAVESSP